MGQGNRKAGPFPPPPPPAALDSLYNTLQPKEGLQVKIITVNYMEYLIAARYTLMVSALTNRAMYVAK